MRRYLFLFLLFNMCTKDPNPPSGASNQIILNTTTLSSITGISAICGGTISSDGGSPITSRGVCWSTNKSPTINNNKTTNGSGLGNFSSNLSLLNPNTTYYVRVYATNIYGTIYGSELQFTTTGLPVVTTNSAINITAVQATLGGNITSNGGSPIIASGIVWNTSPTPTTTLSTKTNNGSISGSFANTITSLYQNTIYYVRAYATNANGTSYGPEITFKTLAINCAITGFTTGTMYSMQSPALGSIFYAGNSYAITMFSSVYTFGQANEVALYLNETKVYSFGTYLLFNNSPGNTRTFNFPSGLTPFPCYTIRVTKTENSKNVVYVTPKFEIR